MTFNTGNPIGSTDARDLSDNAENFDKALGTLDATWTDRLGVTRDSFEGRLAKGSFYRVGTFAAGYTLTNMRQTLEYSGVEYSWSGSFPKVVAAGSTPTPLAEGAWVDRTQETLRSELASISGAGLIAFSHEVSYDPATVGYMLNASVRATDAPFNAPTDGTTPSAALFQSIIDYCATNKKSLILNTKLLIESPVTIHGGVKVYCENRYNGLHCTSATSTFPVTITGIGTEFIGGSITGLNDDTGTTRQDGVLLDSNSSYCRILDSEVSGFFAKDYVSNPGSAQGRGIYDNGSFNVIDHCLLENSGFCLFSSADGSKYTNNYISNHYLTSSDVKPWTMQNSARWDGIAAEGMSRCTIANNIIVDCGQSGIYSGGNNPTDGNSYGNFITNNFVCKCWNRGIDQGVSGAWTAANGVYRNTITGNVCINNRENNIWLAGTRDCVVNGNQSIYDSEYPTLFAGNYGGHVGIAISAGATGADPSGNIVVNNILKDEEGYIAIAIAATATNNTVKNNNLQQTSIPIYVPDSNLYWTNDIGEESTFTFTPQLVEVTGVTLSNATGKYSISGNSVLYEITLVVGSVSSPSGNLVVGYLPNMSGVPINISNMSVISYSISATAANDKLLVHMADADKIAIIRQNHQPNYDLAAYLSAGSYLTIKGRIDFY